jgi:hypothetical protein
MIAMPADGAQATPKATQTPVATMVAATNEGLSSCRSAAVPDGSSNTTAAEWHKYGHYLSICRCIEVGETIGALPVILDWYCEGTPTYGWDLWVLSTISPGPDRPLRHLESAHSRVNAT